MLTPEEMQRITDEERKKVAEEQYRAEVRAALQPASSKPRGPSLSAIVARKGTIAWLAGLALLGAILVLFVVLGGLTKSRTDSPGSSSETASQSVSTAPVPSTRYVPVTQKLATGQIVIRAGGYVQYRIDIEPIMRDAHIVGRFSASGGSGNDVAAAISTEQEFANWINGHEARVYYGTMGKKTTDTFDVRLDPGTYLFAVSNTFSKLSDKYVFLELDLNYERMETIKTE